MTNSTTVRAPRVEQVVQDYLTGCTGFTHVESIGQILVDWYAPWVDLSPFEHLYFTNGITDGLNALSLGWFNSNLNCTVIDGDYQWLSLVNSRNRAPKNDILYISHPSAIDGNNITNEGLEILSAGYKSVVLDCAYAGAGKYPLEPLRNNKITNVFLGASKPLGLYQERVGFVFRKTPMLGLEELKKNEYYNGSAVGSLVNLLARYKNDWMCNRYMDQQWVKCQELGLTASDVVYFATSSDPKYDYLKRGTTNRVCLTDWFTS